MPDIKLRFFHKAIDTYDDDKIQIIESMPEADTILVIWDKLLCQAPIFFNQE